MIKLFFITFFVAELIIALTVILKIYQFDRYVINCNKIVLGSKLKIRSGFFDLRYFMQEFNSEFKNIREIINRKKQQYMFNMLKSILIYGGFFMLKNKYKKAILAYQFVKEVYDVVIED